MGRYQDELHHRFRFKAIERYAIGIVERDNTGRVTRALTGGLPPDDRRRMRNARKQERRLAL